MIVSPFTCACDASKGELPKSKPCGARPPTSPMQSWPIPAARNAKASSTLPTTMILAAPRASATAAVVNALKTSMMTTAPLALLAPDSRLSMLISIASLLAVTHTLWSDKCTNLECWRERPALNKDDSSVGAQGEFRALLQRYPWADPGPGTSNVFASCAARAFSACELRGGASDPLVVPP